MCKFLGLKCKYLFEESIEEIVWLFGGFKVFLGNEC